MKTDIKYGVMKTSDPEAVKQALRDLRTAMGYKYSGGDDGYISPILLAGINNLIPGSVSPTIIRLMEEDEDTSTMRSLAMRLVGAE